MSAKEKIRGLTTAWYGFSLFVGLANLAMNGIGIFSLVGAAIATVFGITMSWVIGRFLLARSSFVRVVIVVLSVVGMIASVLGAGGSLLSVFRGAPLWTSLVMSVLMLANASMNLRSFRVLTDDDVKAYF
jgi:hypothetical protein